jgi:hypothetical protein
MSWTLTTNKWCLKHRAGAKPPQPRGPHSTHRRVSECSWNNLSPTLHDLPFLELTLLYAQLDSTLTLFSFCRVAQQTLNSTFQPPASMPFGIGKKDKGDDLDSQKRSLFGGRSKSSNKTAQAAPSSANPYAAPAPQAATSNPYANQSSSNPYANAGGKSDPYAPKSQSNLSQPPTSSFGSLTLNGSEAGGPPPSYSGPGQTSRDKSPVPPGGYGGAAPRPQNGGGYGQSGYGQGAGYGENPYGNGGASSTSRGGGGYGGLGRSNSQETMGTDAGRNALFGDAPKRVAQQQQEQPPEQSQDTSYGNSGGFSSGGFDSTEMPGGYGGAMSPQEEEDQDVQATKQQIKQYNNDSRDATRRMMAMAATMDETQASTLQTLGQQGERLYNAERHIDQSTTNAETAQKNFKSLKHAQRGMFNPGFNVSGNPFTKSKNEQAHIEREVAHLARQREIREHTQQANYSDNQRRDRDAKELGRLGGPTGMPSNKPSLADRAKYEFEPDDEDDAANNEIDDNL